MGIDAWRPWPKASPELLAHFVNAEAVRASLPPDAFTFASSGSLTLHDLRAKGDLLGIIRALYERLARSNITYELEPVSCADPGRHYQRIRPPKEVIDGKGTCIDLALLFAGACVEAHLLPCILILRSSARNELHALVAVDATHTYSQWDRPRGWTQPDIERGWIEGRTGTALWRVPDGALWQRVLNGKYVLVECTGFATTAADGRASPTLSFDEAEAGAARNVREMEHAATIDIVRLQKAKSYSVYDPERVASDFLHQIIVHNYPALIDFSYESEFRELIAEETTDFVGRSWLAEELARFRGSCSSGYFCIVADAGLGKTAIAASIAQVEQAPAFFFSAKEGRTELDSCLRHLAVEVISRFDLSHAHLPERAGKDWGFLKTLLDEVTRKSPKTLIVIDGIDEATEAAGGNTLFLPERLSTGVHVVLTTRLEPILHVSGQTRVHHERLTSQDVRQREDIDRFLRSQVSRPEIIALLRNRTTDADTLVSRLSEASGGNFMYLRYVLDDLLREPEGDALLHEDKLPVGLTNYYEVFWKAMEKAKDTGGWRDWNELYRPTLALLAAAAEPVTGEWLGCLIGRSPREIIERALTPWKRFLRHQSATGRWWIVHKSFADFLIGGDRVDVKNAHAVIAAHYLGSWGGVEHHLPQLPGAPRPGGSDAYGLDHITHHLRHAGKHAELHEIILEPRWYSLRLSQDPSGDRLQSDALHGLAAAQEQTRGELESNEAGVGISREVSCLLIVGTVNSLSSNLADELPAALVKCGHWKPDAALRAIRLNPESSQRQSALASLAPLLDEPQVTRALNQARADGVYLNTGLVQVLRRLCVLGQAERVLAEVDYLPEASRASVLSQVADVLPEPQLVAAISLATAQLRNVPPDRFPDSESAVLAKLFLQATASLLPSVHELPRWRDHVSNTLLQALAVRSAMLVGFDRCEGYLEAMGPEHRTLTIARLLSIVPESSAALRDRYIERALSGLQELGPEDLAEAIAAVSGFIAEDHLCELVRTLLARDIRETMNPGRVFRAVSPALPAKMLKEVAAAIKGLEEDDTGAAFTGLALRAATLGRPEDAIELARCAGNSYCVGEALLEVLPKLAEFGHPDLAISYAEQADRYGRDHFVPATLIGVSKHVSSDQLNRLRDRAKRIPNDSERRRGLLGIAARYAELNNPTEALALARLIDDDESRRLMHTSMTLSWAGEIGRPERALAEADKLRPSDRWQALEALAEDLPTDVLRTRLTEMLSSLDGEPSDRTESFARVQAATSLLRRLAASGFSEEAWVLAQQASSGRYSLLASLVPYLDDGVRGSRSESVLEDLVREGRGEWWFPLDLKQLVAVFDEASLRKLEATVLGILKSVSAVAHRYAELGCIQDALRLAGTRYELWELLSDLVPQLDLNGIDGLLARLEPSDYDSARAVRQLFARLAELADEHDVLARIDAMSTEELEFAAIEGAASKATPELLEELVGKVFGAARGPDPGRRLKGAAEAIAAIAGRYGALGDTEHALALLRPVSWTHESTSLALVAMAHPLQGKYLEDAIDIALSLESPVWPEPQSRALRALLPLLARHDCGRAMRVAAQVSIDKSRDAAVASVLRSTAHAPASERYRMWTEAIPIVAKRTRGEVFGDLAKLMPLIGEIGGAAALEDVLRSSEQIVQRWP